MADPAPACDKVLLVQAELDGELDAAQAAQLQAHRADCAICQAAEGEILRARGLVRGGGFGPMPDAVRARVMARLAAAQPRPSSRRPPQPRWRLWWPSCAGFGLGAACAAALVLALVPTDRQSLTDQIVAGHIRALQPGHLADVASTDQHTVKPWFDGRLDFAPPVKDFAAQGFPLKGGRLDYLGGRPVAALVYQRDKHIIDVFAWPEGKAAPRPPGTAVAHGYNIVRWSQDGMELAAISDVEAGQLGDFVALWQGAQ